MAIMGLPNGISWQLQRFEWEHQIDWRFQSVSLLQDLRYRVIHLHTLYYSDRCVFAIYQRQPSLYGFTMIGVGFLVFGIILLRFVLSPMHRKDAAYLQQVIERALRRDDG